jgi:stress response protein SCP2
MAKKIKINKLLSGLVVATLLFLVVGLVIKSSKTNAISGSEFMEGRIIDDAIFFNPNTMSVAQIQSFLNSKVTCDTNGTKIYSGTTTRAQYAASKGYPSTFTCLPQYRENTTTKENNIGRPSFSPAGSQSAAEIIFNVAKVHNINPQSLIVLLQKEQALVTDEWPFPRQYQIATGYGCPDTAACDTQYYGFYNQVNSAAKQFRRYADNPQNYRYKPNQDNTIYWSPNTSCGASTFNIENKATSALYNYTPYRPNQAALNNLYGAGDSCSAYGNRNFWRMFRDWFGVTTGVDYGTSLCSSTNTDYPNKTQLLQGRLKKDGENFDRSALAIYAATGTHCVELHQWMQDYSAWRRSAGTPMAAFNPANGRMYMADYDGDGYDDNILVLFRGTDSGKIEVYVMNDNLIGWKANIATNYPSLPVDSRADVIFGDSNGDGTDEANLIFYNNTGSGKIEVHRWTPNLQGWTLHAATSHPTLASSTRADVIFGDSNGDGTDEANLIFYNNTGSGKIEVHRWTPNLQGWTLHAATSHPTLASSTRADVIFGDSNGDGTDEANLIFYNNTGSGKIEVHRWTPNLQGWTLHAATSASTD